MSYVKFLLLEVDHPIAGAGVYLGNYQTSAMEFFVKIVNSFK